MADYTDGTDGTGGGSEPEPSDSLKTFGAVVQAFREHAGLTQEEFAPRVGYSRQTVASIEQGRRFPQREFVERAEEVLEAFGALRKAARHLARKPGLASWFQQWARLEEEAVSLCTYECRLFPGLLQSQGYARAVFDNSVPPLTDEKLEAQLNARMDRQRLLRDKPETLFSFIIEEAVVLRPLGGAEVTRSLLDHVLAFIELRNIELQIMPTDREHHAGLAGPMQLLETTEHRWLGYSEGQESGCLISEAKEVSRLQQRYAKMRSQALTPDDSMSLLKQIRGAL